jgi:hypothetical protein
MPPHNIAYTPSFNILICHLILSITVFCISGCVVPLPSDSSSPALVGHKLGPEEINFINAGVTTRDELISKLGFPPIELEGFKILAYPWIALKRNWVVAGAAPYGGGVIATIPETANNTLFVAIDNRNKVLKWGFDQRQRSDKFSIIAQARRWAESNELRLPSRQSGFTTPVITQKSAVIVLQRMKPAISGTDFLSKARYPESVGVAINEHYCAELLDGEHVAISVPAGSHQILVHPVPPYRFWPGHPGWKNFSSIHSSTITIEVSANKTYFLETQATLETGLKVETSLVVQDETEAKSLLAESVSIW